MGKYEYSESSEGGFQPVDDESEVVEGLLKWLYQSKVLVSGGPDVIFQEELRYIVRSNTIVAEPVWGATIEIFDVREQVLKTIHFRLTNS